MVSQLSLRPSPLSTLSDSEKKESETSPSDLGMQMLKSTNVQNVLNLNALSHFRAKKKIHQNVQTKAALKPYNF